MNYLDKIAQDLRDDLEQGNHVDFSAEKPNMHINRDITLEEHEGTPKSYMVFNNLKTIVHDACELLSIMNENDVLPAWTQEMISISKNNMSKALDYVRSEKTEED